MANSTLNHKGFIGSIEVSIEDECLHGKILFINDIITYEGNDVPDIAKNFRDSVDRYIAYCERTGKEPNKSYCGSFNVRVGPEVHQAAAHAAHQVGVSLNDFVAAAIKTAVTKRGPEKVEHNHNHNHNHFVTFVVQGDTTVTDTRFVSSNAPLNWDPSYGTTARKVAH